MRSQARVQCVAGPTGLRPVLSPSSGTATILVNGVAINVDDGRIRDNEGYQPTDTPIRPDGPAAYFSTLPVKAMVTAMRRAGIPAVVSNTAGTYVCNHLMYQVLYLIDHDFPGKRGGFVHVPYAPQQVIGKPGEPSVNIQDMTTALAACLGAIVEYRDKPDEHTVGGATH